MDSTTGIPIFKSYKELQEFIANQVADFCRDEEFAINEHPMDYDSHFWYIRDLYLTWLDAVDKSDE